MPRNSPFLGRRVHVVQCDQASPEDLGRIIDRFGPPDVVIDDGSHVGSNVITSFRYLFERMDPGGIYVLEDLFCSFASAYGGSARPGARTALGLLDGAARSVQRISAESSERLAGDSSLADLLSKNARTGIAAVHVYSGIAFIEKHRR